MSFWSENFYKLEYANLVTIPDYYGTADKATDWSDDSYFSELKIGYVYPPYESEKIRRQGILRIKDFFLQEKNLARIKLYCNAVKLIGYEPETNFYLRPYAILGGVDASPSQYVWNKDVSGRYFNGYEEWGYYQSDNHPYGFAVGDFLYLSENSSDYPMYIIIDAWYFGVDENYLVKYQTHIEKKGLHIYYGNLIGFVTLIPERVEIWYWEAKIESLSLYWTSPNQQKQITVTGVGLKGYDPRGNNKIKYIHFKGQQGQGTYTLQESVDFTVTGENEFSFTTPALPEGSYIVEFEKNLSPDGSTQVQAISQAPQPFYVGNFLAREKIFFGGCFEAKKKDGTTTRLCFAPIDARAKDQFYSGKIINISTLNRSIEDRSGLYQISDVSITLSNVDKEFSKLLAQYYLRNQPIEILMLYRSLPWHSIIFKGIIDDYDLQGDKITLKVRDFTRKYFEVSPYELCLEDEFPNIHKNDIGAVKPIPYGNLSASEGIIKLPYVDTSQYKYLLSLIPVYDFEIYSDGILKQLTTDYSVEIDSKGQVFIKFNSDQGDKDITANIKGAMHSDYNSSNGYIQNPAYVLLHFLQFFTPIPDELIDFDSFQTVANIFENRSFGTSAAGAITEKKSTEKIISEMVTTFGFHIYQDKNGIFKAEIKDITNFQAEEFIWVQIDVMNFPRYAWREEIINRIIYSWKYNYYEKGFLKEKELEDKISQEDFGKIIEKELKFLWTNDDNFAKYRATEELKKRSYGIKREYLTVPLHKLGTLDIMQNFKLQDPFAPEASGQGWRQRYFYVEAMEYDFQNLQLRIIARDLSYILKQYMILGDENLPDKWTNASEEQRIYAYLCDENTQKFSDGEPGKRLGSEFNG